MSLIYMMRLACLTLIVPFCLNKVQLYPNCAIKQNQLSDTANSTINFNVNFIKLTQFLLFSSASNSIPNDNQGSSQESSSTSLQFQAMTTFYTGISNNTILTFLIIFSISGCVFCAILILRVCLSYQQKLRMFISKQSSSVTGPCSAILCVISITIFCMIGVVISGFPQRVNDIKCQARHYIDVLLNGENEVGWAGLYELTDIINIQIGYYQALQTMPIQYSKSVSSILNRVHVIQSIPHELYNRYQNAALISPLSNTSTHFSDVFPELLGTDSHPLYQQFYNAHKIMSEMGQLAILIQTLSNDAVRISQNASISLAKKVLEYKMMCKAIQQSSFMQGFQFYAGSYHRFSNSSSQNRSNQSQSFDSKYANILIVSKIYIALGLQSTFSYLIIIALIYKIKHNMLLKMANFFWVLMLLQVVMSLLFIYQITAVINSLSMRCPVYQSLLYDSTYYQQYLNQNKPQNVGLYNFNILFEKCLFPIVKNEQNSSQSGIYTQFSSLSHTEYDSILIINLLSSLQSYMDKMNSHNKIKFVNLYQYSHLYQYIVEEYINKQRINLAGSQHWQYLTDLLADINKYTYFNSNNDSCYKHKWVLHKSMCSPGDSIIEIPYMQNLLSKHNQSLCLSLTRAAPTLNTHTMQFESFTSMISNYLGDIASVSPNCTDSVKSILNISLYITDGLAYKNNTIYPLIEDMIVWKTKCDEFLRVLRDNFITKYSQYKYLMGSSNSTNDYGKLQNYKQTISISNNCTTLKTRGRLLYTSICVNARADLMKIYLGTVITAVCLASLIIISSIYGFNEEIKQIQYIYYGTDEDSDTQIQQNQSDINQRTSNQADKKSAQNGISNSANQDNVSRNSDISIQNYIKQQQIRQAKIKNAKRS